MQNEGKCFVCLSDSLNTKAIINVIIIIIPVLFIFAKCSLYF